MTETGAHTGLRTLGYCTNVHAGTTLEGITANLQKHALDVQSRIQQDGRMGIGLWLPAPVAQELADDSAVSAFRSFLESNDLLPFTINGFPYGDFHSEVVKHDVYDPDWRSPARTEYTMQLATILASLLGPGTEGSISTLPLGWGSTWPHDAYDEAAAQIRVVIGHLEAIEKSTGTLIHLDIEPEPGCTIGTSVEMADFVERHMLGTIPEDVLFRYLRVCHDVCHAAVMFDDQPAAFHRYDELGLKIGKVQISSAVRMPLSELDLVARVEAVRQLAAMSESRYLHQTIIRRGDDLVFFDDLEPAVADIDGDPPGEEWRVHFHVPIDIDRFGRLKTTRSAIDECLQCMIERDVHHFEIETYAWDVLPPDLSVDQLSEGIAREINWLRSIAPAGFFA